MIKKRVNEKATIISISCPDALREFNERDDTEQFRVKCEFRYIASDNDTDDDDVTTLLSSFVSDALNGGSLIIDIAQLKGDTLDDKIENACEKLVGKHANFSTFVIDVTELNNEGYTVVNNSEREYSTLSQHYLGKFEDEDAALNSVKKRLLRQIDEGTLEWGEIEEEKHTQPASKNAIRKR